MSAQTKYGYSTPIGAAGGIVDVAPHQIDTFLNEEENGVLKFGAGVVQGSKPGVNIALPKKAATAAKFEGITTNNRTTEYDLEGKLAVRKGAAVGVMRYGKIYGRVAEGVEPAYGDSVYLITEGEEAGCFTNEAGTPAAGEGHQGDPPPSPSRPALSAVSIPTPRLPRLSCSIRLRRKKRRNMNYGYQKAHEL